MRMDHLVGAAVQNLRILNKTARWRTMALTPHYLQKEFNIILGKLGLVEQVPDEVVNENTPDDLEIV